MSWDVDSGIFVDNEKEIPGASWVRNPSGHILVRPGGEADRRGETGWKEVGMTHQCCHCGQHFLSVKGSGMRRGFCLKCMRITCGSPSCDPCIPWQKKMETQEKEAKLWL